ncbi:pentapeptide MXKDX repeat protein [Cupriavidus sp. YR651]|uniref:pentapeptide MXKDX repeat protein n=1 Tax=Cupriavidus sp. YR651 TaxID=1855315 RepID=UPI00088480DB|nr:pentapeptide MXKDX repeat protein [Cupriavidus sp. YR651]SDE01377.1 pentapeptide MXKDX repeat protein [Cupriavidus sp. YR651]
MNKTVVAVVSAMFLMGGTTAFAQTGGSMAKDSMSKDSMSKESMSKDAMSKDSMSKDGMSKDKMGKLKSHDKMSKEGDGMSGGMSK